MGRIAIGSDLNSLAAFVAEVKTNPIGGSDSTELSVVRRSS